MKRGWALLACLPWLAGCGALDDHWQSVRGHLAVMQAARPVQQVLDDPATPAALRRQLLLAQRIRAFAVRELHLPDNSSYRRYAELRRRAVVWNVVAAPPDSLVPKTWCWAVVGCVSYRGYFDEAAARRAAHELAQGGEWETTVIPVPAYSTLGWSNWLGGDPLLSTFVHYPEGELARLIFHEMAHQVVYVAGDTAFNESFATAVERLGVARWLSEQAGGPARQAHEAGRQRQQAFAALTLATRQDLARIYELNRAKGPGNNQKLATKKEAYARFRDAYAALKSRLGGPPEGWAGYDAWVAQANNASLAALAAYEDEVPAFEALFERTARGAGAAAWPRFYTAVKALAALPPDQRQAALHRPMPGLSSGS